jgi:hypothetical protein
LSRPAAGHHAAMVHHDQNEQQESQDEELREAQEGTGYGEDEGERDEALQPDEPAAEPS